MLFCCCCVLCHPHLSVVFNSESPPPSGHIIISGAIIAISMATINEASSWSTLELVESLIATAECRVRAAESVVLSKAPLKSMFNDLSTSLPEWDSVWHCVVGIHDDSKCNSSTNSYDEKVTSPQSSLSSTTTSSTWSSSSSSDSKRIDDGSTKDEYGYVVAPMPFCHGIDNLKDIGNSSNHDEYTPFVFRLDDRTADIDEQWWNSLSSEQQSEYDEALSRWQCRRVLVHTVNVPHAASLAKKPTCAPSLAEPGTVIMFATDITSTLIVVLYACTYVNRCSSILGVYPYL
jgi:hypothetical protein